uniref:Uncharacterized protein n=1 Tax=Melopsittacus undulatus TaxID=13146 RepID=A0A8V5GI52_MELUD
MLNTFLHMTIGQYDNRNLPLTHFHKTSYRQRNIRVWQMFGIGPWTKESYLSLFVYVWVCIYICICVWCLCSSRNTGSGTLPGITEKGSRT